MTDDFFSKLDEPRIVESIRQAELRSRGEIRIHATQQMVADVMQEAARTFERLGMTATAERNGILIFVAPKSQKFAVLGDSGVTSRVGTGPLDEMASSMAAAFREGRFTDGLVGAVERAGALLSVHFPRVEGAADRDELSNTISRG
ncbi:MAG: TPM domain-containing protein [Vicinamibacteria bacterium]|nr:TPM domain-containing protein [Vicinamibacteria bacterium]